MIDEAALIEELRAARVEGQRVYLIGNGGSFANAMHIANDLLSCGVRAFTMDPATFSAFANDFGYYDAFSRWLKVVAEPNDKLIALSGSGRSGNIVGAVETAEKLGLSVFCVTDYLKNHTMQSSEEYQVALGHRLMKALRQ